MDEKSGAGPAVEGVRVGLLSISEHVHVHTHTTISYLLITLKNSVLFPVSR